MLVPFPTRSSSGYYAIGFGRGSSPWRKVRPRTPSSLRRSVILRRIRDEEQGRTEYEISRRLYPLDIAPEVLAAKEGPPYVQLGDACYNLQRFIEHEHLTDGRHWNDAELGRTLSLFACAMTYIRPLTGQIICSACGIRLPASHAGDASGQAAIAAGAWRRWNISTGSSTDASASEHSSHQRPRSSHGGRDRLSRIYL